MSRPSWRDVNLSVRDAKGLRARNRRIDRALTVEALGDHEGCTVTAFFWSRARWLRFERDEWRREQMGLPTVRAWFQLGVWRDARGRSHT